MARALVVYASSEGQTASVAERVGDVLESAGHDVSLVNAKHPPAGLSLVDYDGVVVGASVHAGRHQRYVGEFVRAHVDALNRLPSAFFSVSLSAASESEETRDGARRMLADFLAGTAWEPDLTRTVAGALRYSQYGLMKRFVMSRIAAAERGDADTSRNHEYTDWVDVEAFAREFAALLDGSERDHDGN